MQHFIWEFQCPKDKRHPSVPRGGEGYVLVSVLHLALHSLHGSVRLVQNKSNQNEYIKTCAWSYTLWWERKKLCCNIRFIPVQNISSDFAPPSLTNPSWTMEEPNRCLPVGGDLFLEEGLLSPRTKPNPSGRTKWRKSSLQGRNSTSVRTAALLLL